MEIAIIKLNVPMKDVYTIASFFEPDSILKLLNLLAKAPDIPKRRKTVPNIAAQSFDGSP